MKKIINITMLIAGFIMIFSSCTKDLDTIPLDPNVTTAATVFDDPQAYVEAASVRRSAGKIVCRACSIRSARPFRHERH